MINDGEADEGLARNFRAGNTEAFHTLFRRYQRPIFNYVYRMTGNLAASEDLTQDVFLRVFSSLGRTTEIANFRAWIYRIATNVAISHLRRLEQHVASLERRLDKRAVEEPVADTREDPEQRQLRREAVQEAARALQRLPERQRQTLVLRQLQGLSYQEIAEVMGLSVEAVTSLLHRARREFRDQLGAAGRRVIATAERRESRDDLR